MTFGNQKSIQNTAEFRRVRDLPRRCPDASEVLAREMTQVLKTPAGTMSLRPVQALALHDLGTVGGLAGPIRVGGGKTLVTLLAPHVLEARRPLLLLPAALIAKTEAERQKYAKHWLVPRNLRLQSYEGLGRASCAQTLNLYRPDLIIVDECHRLKNPRAACTRRVTRYMQEHPETHFLAVSGTFIKHTLRDFAHVMGWALKEGAPVPLEQGEIEEWSDALDEKINFLKRVKPGVLGEDIESARLWLRDRMLQTAGVVSTPGDQVSCSLYVRALEYEVNQATEANFQKLRGEWSTPDGWALSQAVDVWRHARELALGMHYVWDPRPKDAWLNARKGWAKFVRETLKHSRTLDSELQVANACDRGELDPVYLGQWREIRPTFQVNSRPVWHDEGTLKACEKWISENKGIVWVEHRFFGDELARRTGLPYFGAGGLDKQGNPIEAEKGDRSVIASIASCGTGRNLQAFSRNLVTSPLTGADGWEQLIGRTHRDGQTADEVSFDILLGCAEHWHAFDGALRDAKMHEDTLGQPQKLLIADITWPSERKDSARWLRSLA